MSSSSVVTSSADDQNINRILREHHLFHRTFMTVVAIATNCVVPTMQTDTDVYNPKGMFDPVTCEAMWTSNPFQEISLHWFQKLIEQKQMANRSIVWFKSPHRNPNKTVYRAMVVQTRGTGDGQSWVMPAVNDCHDTHRSNQKAVDYEKGWELQATSQVEVGEAKFEQRVIVSLCQMTGDNKPMSTAINPRNNTAAVNCHSLRAWQKTSEKNKIIPNFIVVANLPGLAKMRLARRKKHAKRKRGRSASSSDGSTSSSSSSSDDDDEDHSGNSDNSDSGNSSGTGP